jgi:hypothetical protein
LGWLCISVHLAEYFFFPHTAHERVQSRSQGAQGSAQDQPEAVWWGAEQLNADPDAIPNEEDLGDFGLGCCQKSGVFDPVRLSVIDVIDAREDDSEELLIVLINKDVHSHPLCLKRNVSIVIDLRKIAFLLQELLVHLGSVISIHMIPLCSFSLNLLSGAAAAFLL